MHWKILHKSSCICKGVKNFKAKVHQAMQVAICSKSLYIGDIASILKHKSASFCQQEHELYTLQALAMHPNPTEGRSLHYTARRMAGSWVNWEARWNMKPMSMTFPVSRRDTFCAHGQSRLLLEHGRDRQPCKDTADCFACCTQISSEKPLNK